MFITNKKKCLQLANLYWAAEGRTMTADDIHTHLGDDAIPEVRLGTVGWGCMLTIRIVLSSVVDT
jgi:hypothetical protein